MAVENEPASNATIEQMPTINFKGKALVQNFHLLVPYHELKPVKSKSLTEKVSLHDNLVVHGDNLKALKSLLPYYHGKVKCIYIDPPYNSGARDWKYNNNYIDKADPFRHSKWLSMLRKRLIIAKRLMNPADSVLIITIDEKECHHLGMLLEQEFPEGAIQMVSTLINPANVAREGGFGRNDEYIFL